jgi:stearoyl-CoA desaturase (delta-9 desaturase)
MMWKTKERYFAILEGTVTPEPRFEGGYPSLAWVDRLSDKWSSRIGFGAAYTLFYLAFAPHWTFYLLLPVHYLMGPIHGAIVNWGGHSYGYRNFETDDASTNLWPLGVLVAGEELHNNHHAFPTSARFSMRRHEVDLGWLHLKVLEKLGLAKIRRVATPPEIVADKTSAVPELDDLRAVMVNRMHVLRHYTQHVTLPVLRRELESIGSNANSIMRAARKMLTRQPHMLDERSRERLAELTARHPRFQTVLEFRSELKALWEGAHTSNERLLADFREWCVRAEQSGIQGLQEFAAYLKSFRALREPALA